MDDDAADGLGCVSCSRLHSAADERYLLFGHRDSRRDVRFRLRKPDWWAPLMPNAEVGASTAGWTMLPWNLGFFFAIVSFSAPKVSRLKAYVERSSQDSELWMNCTRPVTCVAGHGPPLTDPRSAVMSIRGTPGPADRRPLPPCESTHAVRQGSPVAGPDPERCLPGPRVRLCTSTTPAITCTVPGAGPTPPAAGRSLTAWPTDPAGPFMSPEPEFLPGRGGEHPRPRTDHPHVEMITMSETRNAEKTVCQYGNRLALDAPVRPTEGLRWELRHGVLGPFAHGRRAAILSRCRPTDEGSSVR